jgi:hypothetical protein
MQLGKEAGREGYGEVEKTRHQPGDVASSEMKRRSRRKLSSDGICVFVEAAQTMMEDTVARTPPDNSRRHATPAHLCSAEERLRHAGHREVAAVLLVQLLLVRGGLGDAGPTTAAAAAADVLHQARATLADDPAAALELPHDGVVGGATTAHLRTQQHHDATR